MCVVQAGDRGSKRLRSYPSSRIEHTPCTIWEAARATSAAPLFFDPITIGTLGSICADGGLRHNNPIRELVQEARDIWGVEYPTSCIVSIGTGYPAIKRLGKSAGSVIRACVDIATDTEQTAQNFAQENTELLKNSYYRFNVQQGLQDYSLDECSQAQIGKLTDITSSYLNDVVIRPQAELCASILRSCSTKGTQSNGARQIALNTMEAETVDKRDQASNSYHPVPLIQNYSTPS